MKKQQVALITLVVFVIACNLKTKHESSETLADNNELRYSKTFDVPRDTLIDSANAYNNLFLDTGAVGNYLQQHKVYEADAQAIRGFYNMRNFQFAWFTRDGLTEQGNGFWNAYTYAKSHGQKDSVQDKALVKQMDRLADIDTLTISPGDTSFLATEVALTHRFIRYYNQANPTSVLHQLPLTQLLPARKADPVVMADSVLRFTSALTDSSQGDSPFFLMKQQLAKYDSITKAGGWQPIYAAKGIMHKGLSSPAISAIKKRLQLTGDFSSSDTSQKFSDSLETAVRQFQQNTGYEPNGLIDDSLVAAMNVPAVARLQQILVNMNRMAWVPAQVKDRYVAVNVPEFMLEVHEENAVPVKMAVVVGKAGSNTMMFTGDMNQVVFSPAWNIPAGIVRSEIMPELQNNPGYLKERNMEIVSKNDTLPEIRQLPGPGNALGKVKFLFPNSYDIYLHDTEAKYLFEERNRAFSHGCIRVADAQQLSEYVLKDNSAWTPEKIRGAMNAGKEQFVAVKTKLPVVITYFTTWTDENGQLQFRDDIYQHDRRTSAMMFKNI